MKSSRLVFIASCWVLLMVQMVYAQNNSAYILRNVTVIDGMGQAPRKHVDMLIKGPSISEIKSGIHRAGAIVLNMQGKTIMPSIISVHNHLGLLKGNSANAANYTRENILRQLAKYQDYGVNSVISMGTDRDLLFKGLRDSLLAGKLPGTTVYSAGFGFGVPNGGPPSDLDQVLRPGTAEEARKDIEKLIPLRPDVIKMWVDDFGGRFPKMSPEITGAIIQAAHARGWRVAAHVYYLQDARRLVAQGLDIIAHSIRDSVIDDALLAEMKRKGVAYIPTLSLDEYAYIYANSPEWMKDEFFKASLEPGVYEMISSKEYQDNLRNSPAYNKNKAAFETALKNLRKIYEAGVMVALGTDSGASPVRTQGFSEHLEMELMTMAGLTPIQAIEVATRNGARLLKIDQRQGTLEVGKKADFIVLDGNPLIDIRNTRKIFAVWKNGKMVSKGPLGRN